MYTLKIDQIGIGAICCVEQKSIYEVFFYLFVFLSLNDSQIVMPFHSLTLCH